MGWGVSPTPRPPPPQRKTRYPFYRRLGDLQDRSGRAENLVPTGIRSRTAQPVAQSLYRLSYQTHKIPDYSVSNLLVTIWSTEVRFSVRVLEKHY